ncbi:MULTISPECIES: response regulator [Gordonia]|uniref:response regulator n=1 Tax=Gordonia TaxID=2053 RepID=UPI00226DE70B|nr:MULTISPECIES: response regulator transcription factor [Gordonia]
MTGISSTRVLIADDHAAIRAGITMMLEPAAGIEVVGEAADGDEAVVAADELRADVALMDVRMPGTDGIAATDRIVRAGSCRVIVLTTFDLDDYVFGALRVGASGFLLKTASAEAIIEAVRAVARGDAALAPEVTRRVLESFRGSGGPNLAARVSSASSLHAPIDDLTQRERDVLRCLGAGMTNVDIATSLFITEATVKTHVSRVLMKLDVRSRVQAAILARENGEV